MAALHLRCALTAGLDPEAIGSVGGGQIERVLAGEDPAGVGPPPGPLTAPLDPAMERVCSHLITAMGRAFAEGEITEGIALARLACDDAGEHGAVCAKIVHLLDEAERHDGPPPGSRFPRSFRHLCLWPAGGG